MSVSHFLLKRLIKLYPAYLLSLATMAWAVETNLQVFFGEGKLLADLLLVQSWFTSHWFYFSGNSPAWFLSSLLFCYAAFPLALELLHKNPSLSGRLLLAATPLYIVAVILVPERLEHWFIYIFPPMQFPAFLLGMLLARWVELGEGRLKHPHLLLAIILESAALYAWRHIDPRFSLASYWWLPSLMTIWAIYGASRTGGLGNAILSWKPFVAFGNLSFTFFLLHFPWMHLTRRWMRENAIELPLGVEFLLAAISLTIISAMVTKCLERPSVRTLDTLLARRVSTVVARRQG